MDRPRNQAEILAALPRHELEHLVRLAAQVTEEINYNGPIKTSTKNLAKELTRHGLLEKSDKENCSGKAIK